MMYSVWNQGAKAFDYYETPEQQQVLNTPSPKHIHSRGLGATLDQALWPLPQHATKVGRGEFAKGKIASPGNTSLGSIPMDANTIGMVGLGLAAFLLWRNGFLKA